MPNPRYRLFDATYEVDETGMFDDVQPVLAKAWEAHARPLCLCREQGIAMYVARLHGRYFIKRMPNTGNAHSSWCGSYETPRDLSGFGQLAGSAIIEDPADGTLTLKLGFALSKTGARQAPLPSETDTGMVSAKARTLGLRGLLHLLWEQADLVRWTPAMTGKRNWHVVYRRLQGALEGNVVRGAALRDLIYIPELFVLDQKEQIARRRAEALRRAFPTGNGPRSLVIVVGDVKEIRPARFGFRLLLKHAPDFPLMLTEELHRRAARKFETELTAWNVLDDVHLIVIATFEINEAGIPLVAEINLMTTTSNWLPYDGYRERMLLDALVRSGRRFTKGLRYDLQRQIPIAAAVLMDTYPLPTALFLHPETPDKDYSAALTALVENAELAHWSWRPGDGEIPPLPSPVAPR
jgi:hypothetical protein